jgi:hypothetical protein
LPALTGAAVVRLAFASAGGDGDPFVQGMLDIGVDANGVAIRNALIVSLFGFALILLASLLLWFISRQSQPPRGQSALDTYR